MLFVLNAFLVIPHSEEKVIFKQQFQYCVIADFNRIAYKFIPKHPQKAKILSEYARAANLI